MSESEYKAEIARLRAENESLLKASKSNVKVEKKLGKDGKTWISIKGIPGTGWGLSATAQGWAAFIPQANELLGQVRAQF